MFVSIPGKNFLYFLRRLLISASPFSLYCITLVTIIIIMIIIIIIIIVIIIIIIIIIVVIFPVPKRSASHCQR